MGDVLKTPTCFREVGPLRMLLSLRGIVKKSPHKCRGAVEFAFIGRQEFEPAAVGAGLNRKPKPGGHENANGPHMIGIAHPEAA